MTNTYYKVTQETYRIFFKRGAEPRVRSGLPNGQSGEVGAKQARPGQACTRCPEPILAGEPHLRVRGVSGRAEDATSVQIPSSSRVT